jgi:hypothetical protein
MHDRRARYRLIVDARPGDCYRAFAGLLSRFKRLDFPRQENRRTAKGETHWDVIVTAYSVVTCDHKRRANGRLNDPNRDSRAPSAASLK